MFWSRQPHLPAGFPANVPGLVPLLPSEVSQCCREHLAARRSEALKLAGMSYRSSAVKDGW